MGHIQPDTHLPKIPKIKIYTALISQSSTANPTVIVLQNTLGGTIVWTRDSPGFYLGTLTAAFTTNKTALLIQDSDTVLTDRFLINYADENTIEILTTADDLLRKNTIEIRVYE